MTDPEKSTKEKTNVNCTKEKKSSYKRKMKCGVGIDRPQEKHTKEKTNVNYAKDKNLITKEKTNVNYTKD